MLRCAVLDDYQRIAASITDWSPLAREVTVEYFHEHIGEHATLASTLAPYGIVVVMRERTPFNRDLLEALPQLRLLVTTGAHNASIDLAAARELGITVCGTRGWPGPAAELAWGLIHALMRGIPREDREFHAGSGWQTGIGRSLNGATLGVLGMGRIGKLVARVGVAFGMKVIGWSRSLTPERAAEQGIEHSATHADVLRAADVVVVSLSLNAATRGLIGVAELALMKPTAFLVNIARGPIVDESALVDALTRRQIAGAGLDVFDREPLPADHPLRRLPNVVGTPHVGYVTRENYAVFFADVVEDIRAFLSGSPVRVVGAG